MKMAYLLVTLIGLVASLVGGITGVGGGVVIKPVMDAALRLDVAVIGFLSGCTVLAMTSVSVGLNIKNGSGIDIKRSSFLAVGAVVGGIIGKLMFDTAIKRAEAPEAIGTVQAAIMIAMLLLIIAFQIFKQRIKTHQIKSRGVYTALGLMLGMISAFLGIGGGPLNIVILKYCFSMDAKQAAANSLYVIFFAQITSLITTIASASIPDVELPMLLAMMASGVSGALISRRINRAISEKYVDTLFLALVIVILFISIYNFLKYSALA